MLRVPLAKDFKKRGKTHVYYTLQPPPWESNRFADAVLYRLLT